MEHTKEREREVSFFFMSVLKSMIAHGEIGTYKTLFA